MLPLFAQELPTSCVAACVRMALAALGLQLNESEIRSECGHTPLGMRLNQVAGSLADLPVTIEYHTDWNLDDLHDAVCRSVYPIVGVDLRYVDGLFAFHALVIAAIASDRVSVHDPRDDRSPLILGRQTFAEAWEAADRECLTIELAASSSSPAPRLPSTVTRSSHALTCASARAASRLSHCFSFSSPGCPAAQAILASIAAFPNGSSICS